jgi:ornithine carbamoyltransferase
VANADPILRIAAPDLTGDLDLSLGEVNYLLDLAAQVKASPSRFADALRGRYLSLLFEKPSLRTRVTFELAIQQLGGGSVFAEGPIGRREPIKDVARNLDRWTHAIAARVFSQCTILELAQWSAVPVINALSDMFHPCQALADMLTVRERFGGLDGLKLAFVGDGNNVAHSLMLCAARFGMNMAVGAPEGYQPHPDIVAQAQGLAAACGARISVTTDPEEAIAGANVVYTDVWASMGSEHEADLRRIAFRRYQVNSSLFAQAAPDAIFMHCLPAHRGEEVTEEVIESSQSVVFDEAENRLHAQKALLLMMVE